MVARRPPSPARPVPAATPRRDPTDGDGGFSLDGMADFDDLPDAVVGTDDEFVDSLDLPEMKTPRAKRAEARRKSAKSRKPASSGAAAEALRRARGAAVEDGGPSPLPPRRRAKSRTPRPEPEARPAGGVSLNKIVLLSALAIPAVGFVMYRGFVGHQSDRREWRQAFDDLDDLMNGFADAARASDAEWAAWSDRFERVRPEIEYRVERAPRGSAGDAIGRAVTTMENAADLRADGETGPALRTLVRRAADHARKAAADLGLARKTEWAG